MRAKCFASKFHLSVVAVVDILAAQNVEMASAMFGFGMWMVESTVAVVAAAVSGDCVVLEIVAIDSGGASNVSSAVIVVRAIGNSGEFVYLLLNLHRQELISDVGWPRLDFYLLT